MKKVVRWLRVSYWTGAVVDGVFGVAMAYPKLWALALNLPRFSPDVQHRVDLGVGASLMLSWTCLLLWADRRPIERKGVLLLTIFPALTCLALTGIIAVLSGANSFEHMVPVFIMQAVLIALFTFSYIQASHGENKEALRKA